VGAGVVEGLLAQTALVESHWQASFKVQYLAAGYISQVGILNQRGSRQRKALAAPDEVMVVVTLRHPALRQASEVVWVSQDMSKQNCLYQRHLLPTTRHFSSVPASQQLVGARVATGTGVAGVVTVVTRVQSFLVPSVERVMAQRWVEMGHSAGPNWEQ
jgi:hypothetical protein